MDSSEQHERAPDGRDEHPEPVAVASFATVGEAQVAQAKLEAYGIESALFDDVEGGAIPVQGEPGVVVMVQAADAATATEVLAPPTES
jgi:hypothetical protein